MHTQVQVRRTQVLRKREVAHTQDTHQRVREGGREGGRERERCMEKIGEGVVGS